MDGSHPSPGGFQQISGVESWFLFSRLQKCNLRHWMCWYRSRPQGPLEVRFDSAVSVMPVPRLFRLGESHFFLCILRFCGIRHAAPRNPCSNSVPSVQCLLPQSLSNPSMQARSQTRDPQRRARLLVSIGDKPAHLTKHRWR